jgi:hypothetical protein
MIELAVLSGALIWAINSMINKIFTWKKWEIINYCLVCLSFWTTLVFTFNPLVAAGAALTVWIIEKNKDVEL